MQRVQPQNSHKVQFLLENGADARFNNGCGIKPASINWFDENDSTVQFLQREDNIIENIHDPDSFFFSVCVLSS